MMKQISLFIALSISILFYACGAKEEKREASATDTTIVDQTLDTTNYSKYSEMISDESDDGSDVDSMVQDNTTFPDNNAVLVNEESGKEDSTNIIQEENNKPKEVVKEPKAHQIRYYCVVGSFKKFKNAQNLSKYFANRGYKPMILPKSNGYNRVAISSYIEYNNAKNAVNRFRNKYNDLTFWIYKW